MKTLKKLNDYDYSSRYLFHEDLHTHKWIGFDQNEEVEILFEDLEIFNDNIWNADEEFVIFKTKEGHLGYYHLYPAGYSSYTYEPDITINVYKTDDIEWFKKFALTSDLRSHVRGFFKDKI